MSSGKWSMSSVIWLMPSTEFSAVHNEMANVQFINVVYNKKSLVYQWKQWYNSVSAQYN